MSHSITDFPEGSFIRDLCLMRDDYTVFNNCAITKEELVFSSFFFFRKNYLLLSCATSVRPSVRPSVRLSVRLSVRPSVEIISFRGNSLPNRPIELKIGLNVREGVVHVRKA